MNRRVVLAIATALTLATVSLATGNRLAVTTAKADLKWTDAGVPGVASPHIAHGASHFYLRYPRVCVAAPPPFSRPLRDDRHRPARAGRRRPDHPPTPGSYSH
jgi:hypothetical protein